jgi:hypothetical protein
MSMHATIRGDCRGGTRPGSPLGSVGLEQAARLKSPLSNSKRVIDCTEDMAMRSSSRQFGEASSQPGGARVRSGGG